MDGIGINIPKEYLERIVSMIAKAHSVSPEYHISEDQMRTLADKTNDEVQQQVLNTLASWFKRSYQDAFFDAVYGNVKHQLDKHAVKLATLHAANITVGLPDDNNDNNPLLAEDIAELELPVRAINCLRSENIDTINQLLEYPHSLLHIPNLGKVSYNQIKLAVAKRGLLFKVPQE